MTRKEALKKIRQMSLPKETMEILEALAPELVESEDERIRKCLCDIVNWLGFDSSFFLCNGVAKTDVLAYLEKQKEQKPAEVDESTKRLNDNWIKQHFDEYTEQKPAEWSDTKELVFKDICNHLEVEGYSGWVVLLNALRNGEFQSKQEWSEEDEKDMAHIIRILDDCYVYGTHDLSKTDRENLVNKLKSLRPQYHGDVTMTEAYKMGKEAGEASSWKPSEEQMEALNEIVNILAASPFLHQNDYLFNILNRLREELKKLL